MRPTILRFISREDELRACMHCRHDNDRQIPRTPDEIYELNRAVSRRMNEVFTSRGIPVVPTLGTFLLIRVFLYS